MARKGRVDRGLVQHKDAAGKILWYVRLWHEGKERRFGSFQTKTEARQFYEKAKQEQNIGRFFPERYQRGSLEFVQDLIDAYMLRSSTKKDQRGNRCFARWWRAQLKGKRLDQITASFLEQCRDALLSQGCSPQRVNRYMEWVRHVLINHVFSTGKYPSQGSNSLPSDYPRFRCNTMTGCCLPKRTYTGKKLYWHFRFLMIAHQRRRARPGT